MRGSAVDPDSAGDPNNLLLKVSFELGTSVTGYCPASLSEVREILQGELASVKQDRFLKIALTFIMDEIQYTLEGSGKAPTEFPNVVTAAWDRSAGGGSTRIYYPLFDDATEIAV